MNCLTELISLPPVATEAAISVIAPASFAKQDRIDDGVKNLAELGFSAKFAAGALARGPMFFAGTAQQRIDDLHASFIDADTQIVMCLRGGYGSNYLLDKLDVEVLRKHPKPFFAYSDLTGVQLHLLDKLGLPAFHGPMLAADFYLEQGVHTPSLQAALAGEEYCLGAAEGMRGVHKGHAQGILYGGCLSILVALLGTPWEPQTEGKLLFLEDVGAKPYQIDRMLWQLRAAGKLRGIRGVVFGEMLDCNSPGADPGLLEQVVHSAFADFEGPIAFGLRSGHVSKHNVTLTFGLEAELRVNEDAELIIHSRREARAKFL